MLFIQQEILSEKILSVRLCAGDEKQHAVFRKEDPPVIGIFSGKGGQN